MHFRYLIISGLMVGAAMFLADHAFAAKNELSGSPHSTNAAVQADTSVKTEFVSKSPMKSENAAFVEKPAENPVPTTNNKGAIKQGPPNGVSPQAPVSQKTVSQKPVASSQHFPDQAKGTVQSVIKKAEKEVKATAVQKKGSETGKKQQIDNEEASISTDHSLHIAEFKNMNKAQLRKLADKSQLNLERSRVMISHREDRSDKPLNEERVPTDENEIPEIGPVTNSAQRTNGSGGTSNDRSSSGISIINPIDKWFEWNNDYETQLIQPYLSRLALLSNQWVNAPPSPPPQEAPFLKTVSHS